MSSIPHVQWLVLFAAGWLTLMALAIRARRWLAAMVLACAGAFWLFYAPSIVEWISNLGDDSLTEAQDFDITEALDYLVSLRQILRRELVPDVLSVAVVGGVIAVVVLGPLAWLAGRRQWPGRRIAGLAALAMVILAVSVQVYPAVAVFRSNSEFIREMRANFRMRPMYRLTDRQAAVNRLNVVVYLGESTSSLNMSIYGYPRPTTPRLERIRETSSRLLVFRNVFSTHVHTMPSLLEALSLGVKPEQNALPIRYRQRVSIVDILNEAGVPSVLISNQGSAGTWNNLASTLIFGNAGERYFSFESALLGDLDHRAKRPLDHEFLLPTLRDKGYLETDGPRLVFLHSYAGHGPYWKFIDSSFRRPVDELLTELPGESVVGRELAERVDVVDVIEKYDAAIRYIDSNVADVADLLENSARPAVLVYFSDHGEAVYAGTRHDASRFIHEMARVPFIIYFNSAAVREYPEVFARTMKAAAAGRISTLAQLPATLLALFGLDAIAGDYAGVGLDDAATISPILTRETAAGFESLSLVPRRVAGPQAADPLVNNDPYTALFVASQGDFQVPATVCADGLHTIARKLRAAVTADCLSVEIDGPDALITGSPARLDLETTLDVAAAYGLPAWIHVAAPLSASSCHSLLAVVTASAPQAIAASLVTFPVESKWRNDAFRSCTAGFRAAGFRTGLYLSARSMAGCRSDPSTAARDSRRCGAPGSRLDAIVRSGMFTDLAMDTSVVDIVKASGSGSGLDWNVWNSDLSQLRSSRFADFRTIQVRPTGGPVARR